MALAYLTHRLISETRSSDTTSVHAFVVDHNARPESAFEASRVAQLAKDRYGFHAHVLSLAWDLSPQDLRKGFETRARIARYRALAKACVETGVEHLLLAHHANDQAETVMMRLLAGSRMEGLSGMRAVTRVPECSDVWGAERVYIGRPLLGVEKVSRSGLACWTG
jgi:tRNA(Ile)-lysidine synthase